MLSFRLLNIVRVVLALSTISLGSSVPSKRATVCNGHAELCNRSYGNITHFGSHDSFAFTKDPFVLARDQEVDIPTQLGLGILFDGGTVQDYLTKVFNWLQANPNEVVTLLFTNPESVSLPNVWAPAFQASGIAQMAYVPPSIPMKRSDWPTLGQLIDSGKRVIVFLDYGADTDRSVNYILPEFQMIWETPFSVTDSTFPCSVDRIAGPLATLDHMYMINHSLNVNILDTGIIVSDPLEAPTTNSITSITAHSNGCAPLAGGRAPNFVLLDFVDLGQGLAAVNKLNGF
ncbi:hypothetical protein NLI96_g8587 [Meripilus lineatus]|uniref:PLC-like phosphodiesterase n=1 Tax=Meripilus lineatus TaxID=2056292 RepID=A0AAD5UYM8_9APHY|nr:hypothetical protein NLI96_g8587 [Physisporinus lineatus]